MQPDLRKDLSQVLEGDRKPREYSHSIYIRVVRVCVNPELQ